MAKNDNLKDFLTDVADAIREKKGTTDLINPQDFSAEIASIQSGGGAVAVSAKAVNFRDYDGTILHSYTKDEFLALTELPPLPTREGLICQEWNWDFADAVEYVSEYGVLEVGATYITDDGKTRLYITIAAEGRMDVPLYFNQSVANGVTIDWGDGSALETKNLSGAFTVTHKYNSIGNYIISLDVTDGCNLLLGHNDGKYALLGDSSTSFTKVYRNMLKKIEIGKGLTTISNRAFYTSLGIKNITIPKGINEIGERAFSTCACLDFVVIPKGVKKIGDAAFSYNYGLYGISLPNGYMAFGTDVLKNSTSLSFLMFPQGVTSINTGFCNNVGALSQIILPEGVTHVGDSSFLAIPASSIIFPKSILSIYFSSFFGMTSVSFFDFSKCESVPSMANTNAFTNIPSDCKFIVPDALYDTWIAATNWSTYAGKIIKKSEWNALNA